MSRKALAGFVVVCVALLVAPQVAGAHASFSAAVNATGSAATPYPGNSAQYLTLRVPEERAGPPKLDTVDVKVTVPADWTNLLCLPARSTTANGANPGVAAAGWSCAVEPGSPTIIHWTRAPGATSIAIYFPFAATTGAAGTFRIGVDQTYSSGEVVSWSDQDLPPGCVSGVNTAGTACATPAATRVVGATAAKGHWLAAADGGVFSFGDAAFYGSLGGTTLARPVVGIASTPTGKGYWLVASDGGVFAFGNATFAGSLGGTPLAKPIVGITPTASGKGYWLVASDGGVFAFGDATFFGSLGATPLAKPIVGIAATPSGFGYWLTAADGGVFAFGDATFLGSLGSTALAKPIVGITATPSGLGYWLTAADGGVFTFGNAPFLGSDVSPGLASSAVGLVTSPTGQGYWTGTSAGANFNHGDAPARGATPALSSPVVGIAAVV